MRAHTVPELLDDWRSGARIADKTLALPDLCVGRMVIEQTGLDIGNQMHARLLKLGI